MRGQSYVRACSDMRMWVDDWMWVLDGQTWGDNQVWGDYRMWRNDQTWGDNRMWGDDQMERTGFLVQVHECVHWTRFLGESLGLVLVCCIHTLSKIANTVHFWGKKAPKISVKLEEGSLKGEGVKIRLCLIQTVNLFLIMCLINIDSMTLSVKEWMCC